MLTTLKTAKPGRPFIYQPEDIKGGPADPLLIMVIGGVMRARTFRQQKGLKWNDFYKIAIDEQQYNIHIEMKLIGRLVKEVVLCTEITQETIRSHFNQIANNINNSGDIVNDVMPIMYEIYYGATYNMMLLNDFKNSLIVDIAIKAKKNGFTSNTTDFTFKNMLNTMVGSKYDYSDKQLIFDSQATDWFKKISPETEKTIVTKSTLNENYEDNKPNVFDLLAPISKPNVPQYNTVMPRFNRDNNTATSLYRKGSCAQAYHYDNSLCFHPKGINVKTNNFILHRPTEEFDRSKCNNTRSNNYMLKIITPIPLSTSETTTIHHACIKTAECVVQRQSTPHKVPNQHVVKILKDYIPKYMERLWDAADLSNFKYSPEGWYNGLTCKQQKEVDIFFDRDHAEIKTILQNIRKSMFPKGEKHISTGSDKIRSISNPTPAHKYVVGPVV